MTTLDASSPPRRRRIVAPAGQFSIAPSPRAATAHDGHPQGAAARPTRAAGAAPRAAEAASTEPIAPALVNAPAESEQRLVRYQRRAPAPAERAASRDVAEQQAPARRRSGSRKARPLDMNEEVLVVVADHLGFDVPAIAHAIFGDDTGSSRARILSFLDEIGPRGKLMALRLASVLLGAGAPG